MAEKLTLSFTTPKADLAEREVDEVTLPAALGEVGVLPGHDALMSTLKIGLVTVRDGGKDEVFFVSGGYFEIMDDKLIVLAEIAEPAAGIDAERARGSRKRAEERLAGAAADEIDAARAERALARAEFRLQAAETAEK